MDRHESRLIKAMGYRVVTEGLKMKFDLDIPKMGYFIVYDKGGFFGDRIEKKQLAAGFAPDIACTSHVEVLGGGPLSVCVAIPTTKIVDITKRYKGRRARIVKYYAPNYNKRRYKVAFWSASGCNLPYDILGVASFMIPVIRFFNKFKAFFCSENCLWALQKEYKDALGGLKPDKAMPAHFLTKEFRVVWDGVIE